MTCCEEGYWYPLYQYTLLDGTDLAQLAIHHAVYL